MIQMGRDNDIANRLREVGLRVVEVAGWQTAGSSSFYPGGSVNHHTAGGPNGATPSFNTCINGRPDLPGPLCNVYQSRESNGDDVAYVISSGRANHAGEGGWKGLSGNSSVYGLEIEHTGVDPLPVHRQDIAALIHSVMWQGDVEMVCQHREWTSRKIDAAEGVDGDDFRQRVKDARKPPPPVKPNPTQEDDMFTLFYVKDGTDTGTYYAMTPWNLEKISFEDGYFLDAGSPGLYAVVVPNTATWNVIRKNAPTYRVTQT